MGGMGDATAQTHDFDSVVSDRSGWAPIVPIGALVGGGRAAAHAHDLDTVLYVLGLHPGSVMYILLCFRLL